jgi:cold-inducible RNA-binding protein
MAKKLYVGNLPFSTTDADLKDLFGSAGAVTGAQVIMNRDTGRSKGFGFVEMSNDEEAMAAIDTFNGKDFGGRNLVVNEARPMEARPPRTGGFGGGRDRGGFGGGRGGFGGGRGGFGGNDSNY